MIDLLKKLWREEDGLGTVELVIIVAVLVGIALIFRKAIFGYVQQIIGSIFTSGDGREFLNNPTQPPTLAKTN